MVVEVVVAGSPAGGLVIQAGKRPPEKAAMQTRSNALEGAVASRRKAEAALCNRAGQGQSGTATPAAYRLERSGHEV